MSNRRHCAKSQRRWRLQWRSSMLTKFSPPRSNTASAGRAGAAELNVAGIVPCRESSFRGATGKYLISEQALYGTYAASVYSYKAETTTCPRRWQAKTISSLLMPGLNFPASVISCINVRNCFRLQERSADRRRSISRLLPTINRDLSQINI